MVFWTSVSIAKPFLLQRFQNVAIESDVRKTFVRRRDMKGGPTNFDIGPIKASFCRNVQMRRVTSRNERIFIRCQFGFDYIDNMSLILKKKKLNFSQLITVSELILWCFVKIPTNQLLYQ